jgi:hypothetical protein
VHQLSAVRKLGHPIAGLALFFEQPLSKPAMTRLSNTIIQEDEENTEDRCTAS